MTESAHHSSDRFAALASPVGASVVFVLLLVARLLAANRGYFYEGDEISIAAGVAQLLNGDLGPFYRYAPMLGYYRLTQVVSGLFGGTEHIHAAMLALSAFAGAAIPAAALRAFVSELSPRTRVLTAALLFANPALWIASQYGNAGVVSVALVVLGAVVLSNRGDVWRLPLGLLLYSLGVFVRADAVLAAPMIALLVYRRFGTWRPALTALGTAAVLGALTYALLFALDPALEGGGASLSAHFEDAYITHFFEHLMWAFSPFVLAFIVLGGREGLARRDPLLWVLLLGVLPAFGFYFSATTTTRYFLISVFPLSILGAWGATALAELAPVGRRGGEWALVLGAAFIHLFVGLGYFTARPFSERFKAPSFDTHDSGMPTGALLYQAYLRGGVFGRSLRGPRFGSRSELAQSLDPVLRRTSDGAGPERVTLLFHGWNGHAAAYHLAAAGARVVAGASQGGQGEPIVYNLGRTALTLRFYRQGVSDPPDDLALSAGDELWLLRPIAGFPDARILGALDPGFTLRRTGEEGSYLETYRVVAEEGGSG